ncbi:UNVERIFIED_CONTAM: hypothetical protein H355_009952 [Colinus virginianus]|nr:hypothetical protein H355_009952 [Colinus virginianus]
MQGKHWLAATMAARATFGPWQTAHTEMGLSAANETASAADLEELVDSSGSASTKHAGWDQDGPAAGSVIAQEQNSPTFSEEEETKSSSLSSSEEYDWQASDFSSLSFPQKLWVLDRSDRVKSIWWALGGNCIVIEEELFTDKATELAARHSLTLPNVQLQSPWATVPFLDSRFTRAMEVVAMTMPLD